MEKQEQPLVTVWCLTYNQKDYIRDALNGFVMQKTNFKYEVIVHDDASTDGTTDIVKEYAHLYPDVIKPVIETENQWKHGGLKHIIDIMNDRFRNGKYIAFCEGDDFWTSENKLQYQVDFLESHLDYSMCFHSAHKQYECNSDCWLSCENIKNRDYSATELFVNWTVPTASILCRNEVMDFYSHLKGKQRIHNYDIFIILSCCMVGKVRGFNEQMSVYRIQGNGLTYDKKALVRCILNNPEHFKCLKDNFPVVESFYINDTLSKVFYERGCIQSKFMFKLQDFHEAFSYSPRRFLQMFMRQTATKILKLIH